MLCAPAGPFSSLCEFVLFQGRKPAFERTTVVTDLSRLRLDEQKPESN